MSYPQIVKEIAYAIDPIAFVSYSGYSSGTKRTIEARRNKALRQAQDIYNNNKTTVSYDITFIEDTYKNKQEMLRAKILETLDAAIEAIEKRAVWINNRKSQQKELKELSEELCAVYGSSKTIEQKEKLSNLIIQDIYKLISR